MNSIKKTDHFYLIDGSGYIFRAYYALPPLSRKSDGLPTGAVNGFCNMLYKLLEESRSDDSKNKPTHFAVIFDAARKKDAGQRTDLDAGMAKLYATEVAQEVVLEAMRIHGGVGYSNELPIERYYRDAPVMVIAEGTSDIQKLVIARNLLREYQI